MKTISTRGVKDTALRYKLITRWAGDRYRRPDGSLVLSTGKVPSRYSLIENLAAMKLFGCRDAWPNAGVRA